MRQGGGVGCTDGRWKKGTQASFRKTSGENNIICDLKEEDYEGDLNTLAQDRVTRSAYVLEAMNLRVP